MADQGKWFKLWCSADEDPDLSELSLEDFARWVKLGMYIKKHGSNGAAIFRQKATILQEKFRVKSSEEVFQILKRFPNCDVHEKQHPNMPDETIAFVSFSNWHKYQGDMSTERVREFREMKRPKKRGEEKRTEQKKSRTPPTPSGGFEAFWQAYPRKKAKGAAEQVWGRLKPTPDQLATMLRAIERQKAGRDWTKDGGQFIPHPATWLNQRRWEDSDATSPGGHREAEGEVHGYAGDIERGKRFDELCDEKG